MPGPRGLILCCVLLTSCAGWRERLSRPPEASPDTLRGSLKRAQDNWIYVHVEGAPERIGFQHGFLLADEIAGVIEDMRVSAPHESGEPWQFYRETAQRIFWPRVPNELRAEIKGMVTGLRARGKSFDE